MGSRAARAAAALVAVAVAAGCSEIPTAGPVVDAGAVGPPPEEQRRFIEVVEAPPEAGMTPVEIVDGFIQAMGSYQPGYETARQFLTEEAAADWDSSAGVTVFYEARPATEAVGTELIGASTVNVQMTVRGEVGVDGSFRELYPAREQAFDLQLRQENGEWRITNPVPGIVIADFSFDREFQARNVFFFDPAFEVLVPDPIYLPRTANEATATLLARKVLAGPSDWLAPAVATAFPEGAALGVDAVPVRDGVATVELSAEAVLAGPDERERMAAQLTWTLGVLPEVEEVEVLTSGLPLIQGGEPMSPEDPALSKYDPAVLTPDVPLYAIGEAGVAVLTDGELTPVPGPLGAMADARELAVNIGGNRAVVITGEGTELQVASFGEDEVVETLLQGVDLGSLSWDRGGLIWAVDGGIDGPGVVVLRPDGERVEVISPQLAGREVDRIAVSPDGARVALVAGGEALVGDVLRETDAAPVVRIEQLRPIGPRGTVRDIAWSASSPSWSAADAVLVLLETERQGVQPYLAGLSGQETSPRGVPAEDATRVAGTPGRPTVLESGDGVLYVQRSTNSWAEIGPGRSPAYPG